MIKDEVFHLSLGVGICGYLVFFIPMLLCWLYGKGTEESLINIIINAFLCELFIGVVIGLVVGGFIMLLKILEYLDITL